MLKILVGTLLLSVAIETFAGVVDVKKVAVKVIKNDGDLALIVKGDYVIDGAPIYPCKINGKTEACYRLRKAEKP